MLPAVTPHLPLCWCNARVSARLPCGPVDSKDIQQLTAAASLFTDAGLQEGWEPGQAFRDMEHRLQAVVRQRADIEEARKVRPRRNLKTYFKCKIESAGLILDLSAPHFTEFAFSPATLWALPEAQGSSRVVSVILALALLHVLAPITVQLAKKRLPPPGHPLSAPSMSPQTANGTAAVVSPSGEAFISPEDYVAQDEIYKASCTSNILSSHPFLQCRRNRMVEGTACCGCTVLHLTCSRQQYKVLGSHTDQACDCGCSMQPTPSCFVGVNTR